MQWSRKLSSLAAGEPHARVIHDVKLTVARGVYVAVDAEGPCPAF